MREANAGELPICERFVKFRCVNPCAPPEAASISGDCFKLPRPMSGVVLPVIEMVMNGTLQLVCNEKLPIP